MEAITAITSKRDTRSYTEDPVDPSALARVVNAARMAGSAKNVQPVRVITVTDPQAKVALKAGGDYASWIDQAPVLAVFTVAADAGPRRMFDVGRHAQNLMIAARAEGLASCPVTLHHQDEVRAILGIPAEQDAPMLVSLGHPAETTVQSPIAGPRVAVDTYSMAERWQS